MIDVRRLTLDERAVLADALKREDRFQRDREAMNLAPVVQSDARWRRVCIQVMRRALEDGTGG